VNTTHPIAIIGAGPVGLAAAAHLAAAGEDFVVLESGETVADSVRSWGHVRVFSPWRYNIDSVAARLLDASGWTSPPEDGYPTGREIYEQYLQPLAVLPEIAPHVRFGARVESISRLGMDKLKSEGREQVPFEIAYRAGGREERLLARAVIDASGTYRSPNPLGASGVPAQGESDASGKFFYGIPDILGEDRQRYTGKRVLVVGGGHSAFNALHDLAELAGEGTSILWAVRAPSVESQYGGGSADQLPRRGELGASVQSLVADGRITLVSGFRAERVQQTPDGVVVSSSARTLPAVDEVIVATGFRPDLAITSELRLELDNIVESPSALATLIDPNLHSCGTVPPHGAAQLRHPEPDFYTVGMKSYGRAPTFLMLTGYEQVRSVVAALTGDVAGSLDVRLVLPETGVCNGLAPSESAGCCGGAAPAGVDACCVLDAQAKEAGEEGCGCGAAVPAPELAAV